MIIILIGRGQKLEMLRKNTLPIAIKPQTSHAKLQERTEVCHSRGIRNTQDNECLVSRTKVQGKGSSQHLQVTSNFQWNKSFTEFKKSQ